MDEFVAQGFQAVAWEIQGHLWFYAGLIAATFIAFHPTEELRRKRFGAILLSVALWSGILPLLWMEILRKLFPGPSTRGAVHLLGFVVLIRLWIPVLEWLSGLIFRRQEGRDRVSRACRPAQGDKIRLKF